MELIILTIASLCWFNIVEILHPSTPKKYRSGTDKEIKNLLKGYDNLIKRKKDKRISVCFDTLSKTGVILCHTKITKENQNIIRELLISQDWNTFFNNNTVKSCPIHGGMEDANFSLKKYKFVIYDYCNSLDINYI